MKDLKRLETLEKPSQIQQLGNNTYYYNYDIKSCQIHTYNTETEKEEISDGWSYVPVYIYGQPEYKSCVKNIIRLYLTQDEEFDLINSYNKTIITGNCLDKSSDNYFEYLKLLDNIKKEVKLAFKYI